MSTIDSLWEAQQRSESVHLDVIAPDASSAVIMRLCRYPEHDAAWLWVNVFHDGEAWAHYDHSLPCSAEEVMPDDAPATYAAADASLARFQREGPHDAPTSAFAEASVEVSPGFEVPLAGSGAPGGPTANVRLDFEPLHSAHSTFRGRSEVIGRVHAAVDLGGRELAIEGFGHWHEQHQHAPRFIRGFRYITLRGEQAATISVLTERVGRGFVVRDGEVSVVTAIEIEPRGERRRLRLTLEGSENIEGELVRRYDYSVPIYDGRRPGSLVSGTLDGAPVSGQINDWPGLVEVRTGAADLAVTRGTMPG
jgi:hypothetical protein